LDVDDWPDTWAPLALFLGRFTFWQFEPPIARFTLAAEQTYERVAADGDEAKPSAPAKGRAEPLRADMAYASLAAHGNEDEVDEPSISAASAHVAFQYVPRKGTLEITASLPEDSEGETVVAELRAGQGEKPIRRAAHLDYRRSDGRYKANVFGFFPTELQGDLELVVRPPTEEDLALLDAEAVGSLLSRQDYVSMPIDRSDDGFVFSVADRDQQELAADASTCWALSVAKGEEV
jgi:hypothetical protein